MVQPRQLAEISHRCQDQPTRYRLSRLLFARALTMPLLALVSTAHAANHTLDAHIPAVHGTTFSDTRVDLPDSLHGKLGILVVGFTQGSRDAVTAWGKRLATDYYDSPTVAYYEMPVLASVPKLLRGWVTGRIKSSVSDRGKPHFLPLTDDEPTWRSLVRYNAPDDPYILLIDEHGTIRWQTQGPPTDATYSQLQHQIATIHPH